MLLFGVDVPLIEIVLALTIMSIILLVQSIVLVTMLVKQQKQNRELVHHVEDLSKTILSIKKAEMEELNRLHLGKSKK